jgi:hypothetical protein
MSEIVSFLQFFRSEFSVFSKYITSAVVQNWKPYILHKVIAYFHNVHTDAGARTASYPISTGGNFPGGKAAGAWS